MSDRRIGVIGGTGLGEKLAARSDVQRIEVDTPFGRPSAALLRGPWGGSEVVFLNRHGDGHTYCPSAVPYRANIFAMKQLGVTHLLASGAVGSLREEIEPGQLVICDQVIDKTHARAGTFYDEGFAVHVEMAEPFCPALRRVLLDCADGVDAKVHTSGTYVVMEGPQFSTRAESHMHRTWGGDLIGMTCMPEAKLAREAEICYALVALPTDYDCWRVAEPAADKQNLLAEIIGNLNKATRAAEQLIEAAVTALATVSLETCGCPDALALGIWSDKAQVDADRVRALAPLVGKYFEQ